MIFNILLGLLATAVMALIVYFLGQVSNWYNNISQGIWNTLGAGLWLFCQVGLIACLGVAIVLTFAVLGSAIQEIFNPVN